MSYNLNTGEVHDGLPADNPFEQLACHWEKYPPEGARGWACRLFLAVVCRAWRVPSLVLYDGRVLGYVICI